MITTIGSTLLLGFILGVQHALDADHVVAVSTIVSRERKPMRAAAAGLFWGMGHTITLLLVGIFVLVFKKTIPVQAALSMEFLVGALLVGLGIQILWEYWRKSFHTHSHGTGRNHIHFHAHNQSHQHRERHRRKSLLVGMIHGLAGGGALVLLVLATIDTLLEGVAYVLVFGVGSILGMMIISTLLGLPFAISATWSGKLNERIRLLAGAVSVVLGVLVMVQISRLGGLFSTV